MAQMAERSLPTPEIRGSKPDREDGNKEKEAGNGPLKKVFDLIIVFHLPYFYEFACNEQF